MEHNFSILLRLMVHLVSFIASGKNNPVHPFISLPSSSILSLGLLYPLSLEQASVPFCPLSLIFLSAIPGPLVNFGAIETELIREHYGAILIKLCALLVLPLQNYLLVLVEMLLSHAISLPEKAVTAAVAIRLSRSFEALHFL